MAQSVGTVALDLKLNSQGVNSQLNGLMGVAKKVGAAIAGAFAIKKTIDFGKECIELGSDLNEVQNVVDVAFPKMSGTIDKFAKNAATQFGLSETMAKRYAGTFGSMSKSFGFSEKEAADMSTTLTGLSGDVASFYNISQDEAYTKLKSVFTGETESLKDLGVVMTQTALDQYALQNGFGKTTDKMSEQEKVALRYSFVQSKLADASGDFARTSDSWANQTRILSLQMDSLKASIGQGLINVFTPVLKLINTLLGKLSALASAFKSFTDMITGNKSSEESSVKTTSDELAKASDNSDSATSGVNNLTKATKKAAKAAKSLASFDQLNVKQQDSSSDSDDSGSGGAGAIAGMSDATKGIDASSGALGKMDKLLSTVLNKIKKLAKLFGAGFSLGFKSDGFDKILGYLKNIGSNLKEIFTDPEVVNAASNWVDTIIYNFGRILGSIASIGVSIATMLIGGVNKFLDQNKDFIKTKLVEIFNISSERATIWGNFFEAIADIFTVFEGDDAQQIVADILAIFTTAGLELYVLCEKIGRDVLSAITTPIIENKDGIKNAISDTLAPIKEVVGGIKEFIQGVFQIIQSNYDEYVKPAFDNIGSGLSTILSYVIDGYESYIAPVFDRVADGISDLLNTYIKPLVGSVVGFIGRIIDAAGKLFNFLSPIIGWIIQNMMAKLGPTIEFIWIKVKTVISFISVAITTLMNVINGIIDFIVGIFTGDWQKAWDGIKEIFGSVFDGIKNVIKIAMDFVKSIIIAICSKISSVIKNVASGIFTILKKAWELIKNVFAGASGVREFFKKSFFSALESIKEIWKNPGAFFVKVWNGIKGAFSHVGNWFKNTFSGAWKAVKDVFCKGGKVFTGIKEGIASVFKTVVNALISGINFIISKPFNAINKMLNMIRDVKIMKWHPFKKLWNENPLAVPQIPKLANGAVLKPNAPFLAMVGDQKHGTNIEAPLETIKQGLREVQQENGIGNQELLSALSGVTIQIVVQQNSKGVFNMVKQEVIQEKRKTGRPVWNN